MRPVSSPSATPPATPAVPAASRGAAAEAPREAGGASIRRLWVLMATVFVDMIGAMIVMPLLPFYVLEMKAKPSIVGPLVSAFFLAQIVFSPVWGRLSDRYGRRPTPSAILRNDSCA